MLAASKELPYPKIDNNNKRNILKNLYREHLEKTHGASRSRVTKDAVRHPPVRHRAEEVDGKPAPQVPVLPLEYRGLGFRVRGLNMQYTIQPLEP